MGSKEGGRRWSTARLEMVDGHATNTLHNPMNEKKRHDHRSCGLVKTYQGARKVHSTGHARS